MKVKHLIVELLKCDQEAEVTTEGCDCEGDTGFVNPAAENIKRTGVTVVMICRSDATDYVNTDEPQYQVPDRAKKLKKRMKLPT